MSDVDDRRQRLARAQEIAELRDRVSRLEGLILRAGALAASAAIVIGLFVPFLTATESAGSDDEDETISLFDGVFALTDAGDGPFESEAAFASLMVGIFVVVALATLITLLALLRPMAGRRNITVARALGITLVVGCGGAWLLVLALSGHTEGDISKFSPAVAWMTAGAIGGVCLRHLAPRHHDATDT